MYLRHGSLSLARPRTLADALAEGGDRQHSLLQPNRQCDDNKQAAPKHLPMEHRARRNVHSQPPQHEAHFDG
jgi:hypothetical protein